MLLLARTTIEYTSSEVSFTTNWDNVVAITHVAGGTSLQLRDTPHELKLPLGGSRAWLTSLARRIPLEPFGYPNNPDLYDDICRFAPNLRAPRGG